jgi:predicted XRE-type DNA-binding protein
MQSGSKKPNTIREPGRIPVQKSSGNVFEDIGASDSAQLLVKAELAASISATIKRRRLKLAAAATILEIDQPSVSDLVRGRLRGFSSDRLFRFLNALGSDVEIIIRPRRPAGPKPGVHVVEKGLPG